MAIRILVVDDHEVIRTGLNSLLNRDDMQVVGVAISPDEALLRARELGPDVVLLDIRLCDGDGLDAMEQIRDALPEVKVIVLSTYDNPTYMARANALGASDYLLKGATGAQIVDAVRRAAEGGGPSPHGELQRMATTLAVRQRATAGDVRLTKREAQVLRHLAMGLSNKEIGRSMDISVETVKEHVQHVLRKIAVNDRTQAAVWAVRNGIA